MKASTVLRKAGDILRARGWRQGWFVSRDDLANGPVCMLGACNTAVDGNPEAHGAIDKVPASLFALDTVIDDPVRLRANWNDAAGRTQADVEQALDAAYVLALQEEGIEPADVLESPTLADGRGG